MFAAAYEALPQTGTQLGEDVMAFLDRYDGTHPELLELVESWYRLSSEAALEPYEPTVGSAEALFGLLTELTEFGTEACEVLESLR